MPYGEGQFTRIRLPGTLTTREAAKALGVSTSTFSSLVSSGQIHAVPRDQRPEPHTPIYRESDIVALGIKRLLRKGLKAAKE